jgi:CO/xanthine dehydrogenase Mo-binding subunit
MVFLKTIVLWIVEWAVTKAAILIKRWWKREQSRKKDEKSTKEVREKQEKAETPKEREDAARGTIGNF